MAKAKKTKNKKKSKKVKGAASRGKARPHRRVFTVLGFIMAAIFMPSTVLLCVGMLPTVVAVFVDRSRKKNKAITVGSINLVGCMPFLLELWSHGHSIDASMNIVSDPMAIVVMYSAAGIGYLIDWGMTGLVSTLLYDRGQKRTEAIKVRQAELVERWGREVTGSIPLDEYGFPLEEPNDKENSE